MVRGTDGRQSLGIGGHAGIGNASPPPASIIAATHLLEQLTTNPAAIQSCLRWRRTIAATPMNARLTTALIQPVITSVDEVLPVQWKLDTLLRGA